MIIQLLPCVVGAASMLNSQPVSQAPTPPLNYAWVISDQIAERLADDLLVELDDEKHAAFDALFATYRDRCEEKRSELESECAQLYRAMLFEIGGPEIEEDYDISDLSEDEQERILKIRRYIKQGIPPFMDDRRFMDPLDEFGARATLEIVAHEKMRRRELTTACAQLACGEQPSEIAARALRRLPMNMHALVFLDPPEAPKADPIWKLDTITLLKRAAAPGGELEQFSEIILDAQHAVANHDGVIGQVATLIAAFEAEYGALVGAYGIERHEWGVARLKAGREGRDRRAYMFSERDARARGAIVGRRRQFADQLGALLTKADPILGQRWIGRYRHADCPSLFLDDSVDTLVAHLYALDNLRADERQRVEAIYELYQTERALLLDHAYELELEEFATRRRRRAEPEHWTTPALDGVHESRVQLADRTLSQLRGSVDAAHRQSVDQVIAEYRVGAERARETRP